MLAFFKKLFASQAATPPPDVQNPLTEDYLNLMLEWGTIADIPNLVRGIRRLKARIAELESKNEQ